MANDFGDMTLKEYLELQGQLSSVRDILLKNNQNMLYKIPYLDELINQRVSDLYDSVMEGELQKEAPTDGGLLHLSGLGDKGASELNDVRVPPPLPKYEDTVTSERLLGIADLYYIYQHERVGVFRAILKMQELFKAGGVRLASGPGALGLYQYDRQKVLRYTNQERMQAYRRVFGYTNIDPVTGAKPNDLFHELFSNFNGQVARYFRDKRISEVVRPDGRELTYGSVAIVRRAGLDLRNNLKGASYGHVNVMRVEVLQLLEHAFEILGSEDVRNLFGADNAWDVLEEIMRRYFKEQALTSQRSRMAQAGREILRFLSQPDILTQSRVEFEGKLLAIAEHCEEWLTSAESLGLGGAQSPQAHPNNVIPLRKSVVV